MQVDHLFGHVSATHGSRNALPGQRLDPVRYRGITAARRRRQGLEVGKLLWIRGKAWYGRGGLLSDLPAPTQRPHADQDWSHSSSRTRRGLKYGIAQH